MNEERTQQMPEDRTERMDEEETQRLDGDRTQRISREQTQRMDEEPTERVDGRQTQRMIGRGDGQHTQHMDEEPTERISGDPNLEDLYVHFGPGVPMVPAPDRATAIWRSGSDEGAGGASAATAVRASKPRGQRWILPLTVLILVVAVVAYFLFGRPTPALTITGVTVRASSAQLACSGQEVLTGAVATDGGAGTVVYQWVRSDGTKSDVLRQSVNPAEKLVDVKLLWSFEGTGSLHATAVLDILGPGTARSASVTFAYSCSG